MNLENIEAFVHVVHFGSFNKAATALFLSQPSVTARIKTLEQELQCQLFERAGKHVHISEEGKRFLPYAEQLLLTYKTGKQQIQSKKLEPDYIRIGCTVSASNYIAPALLPFLHQKYPTHRYKIVTASTDELVQKVMNQELDLAIVRKASYPTLHAAKLLVDPIQLCVYEDHPFLLQETVTVQEVALQPLIFFECGSLDWLLVHHMFESNHCRPNITIHTDHNEMARKLIMNKQGIGFLPSLSFRQELIDQKLIPIEIVDADEVTLQTNIVCLPGYHKDLFESIVQFGKTFR